MKALCFVIWLILILLGGLFCALGAILLVPGTLVHAIGEWVLEWAE